MSSNKTSTPSCGPDGLDLGLVTLRITEIFWSLQGETTRTGLPTVFVRLTGCPLRCRYCDTAYAFSGGSAMAIPELLTRVMDYNAKYVTVTGGEPLAQKNCLLLLQLLCDAGFDVSLETSGAIDIGPVDPRVVRILDIKTPGSGEMTKNLASNIDKLTGHDQIKFVLTDRADYDWAKSQLSTLRLTDRCEVLLSPATGQLPPHDLADWILADKLAVRFQLQLHKILWGDFPGH